MNRLLSSLCPPWVREVPFRTIWGLVWPQMSMLLCTIVISLTDIWAAGQLSAGIQAAVGLTFQVQTLLLVFGWALGSGSMAAVTQSMGGGKPGRARNYVSFVLAACVGIALAVACIVYLLRRPVLILIQTPEALMPVTEYILGVMLLGLPAYYTGQVAGTLFRAARQVMAPLFVVMISCLLNIFGDLCLGLGWLGFPAWGMKGIVWSSFGANVAAALLSVHFLQRGGLLADHLVPPLRWLRKGAPYLFRVAIPAGINSMLWQAGYLVMYSITASLPDGVDALAGLTAGNRIESLLYMPATAFMVTASILVGNALGAGDKLAAKRAGITLFVLAAVSMSSVAACMWPFIPDLARFFSGEAAVQRQIVNYLFFNVLVVPFTVSGMVLNGVMNGAGATVYSMIVNVSCIWLIRLPVGWVLAHLVFHDACGVYMAMFLSMAVQTSLMFWVFQRKDWTRFALNARHTAAHRTAALKEEA